VKLVSQRSALSALAVAFAATAACADSEDPNHEGPPQDGGPDTNEAADADAAPDAEADADIDASALRCSGDFCLVDLPNPAVYGLDNWHFTGVHVDPQIGAWAIANGAGEGDEGSTAQVLHFDGTGWKVAFAATLEVGLDARNVQLTSLTGDNAGHLLAVGSVIGETTGVVLQSDGTTFSVTSLDEELRAAWYVAPGNAWIVGNGGRIFRSTDDGGWESEHAAVGDFGAVWGTASDLYVGGTFLDEEVYDFFGYLGHRTTNGASVEWSFAKFGPLETNSIGWREIYAGITIGPGASWFGAAPDVLARTARDGGDEVWERDAFKPPIPLMGFWARSPNEVWAVGDIGRVYHFDGTSWKDARLVFNGAPLTATLFKVSGTSSGELFIVGDGVALRRAAK
jgi:hypothetical protein